MKTPLAFEQYHRLRLRDFLPLVFLIALIAGAIACFAQDTNNVAPADAPAQVTMGLTNTIVQLAEQYPLVAGFLILLGSLRLFIKPLMAGIRLWTASTETKRDDEILDKVERSWLYTAGLFLLDWLTSIKLKPSAKPSTANKALGLLMVIGGLTLTSGCAGRTTAQVVRALSKDPASLHVRITTIYGTIEVARTAPGTNTPPHAVGADGTITVK